MNVVAFRRPPEIPPQIWQVSELQVLTGACAASVSRGQASGWEVGATERGDPQLYLIGNPPEHDCVLCISRLGRLYVLEDGEGRVLFEHDSVMLLAEQMRAVLARQKGAIVARLAIAWCFIRETFEEKVEPLMGEPAELLAHVAPQFAALV
jgi:hypothetical protein